MGAVLPWSQRGTLALKELGAVVSLASCHPVCDTQSYTVINTQLSAKKNISLEGSPLVEEQQLDTQH